MCPRYRRVRAPHQAGVGGGWSLKLAGRNAGEGGGRGMKHAEEHEAGGRKSGDAGHGKVVRVTGGLISLFSPHRHLIRDGGLGRRGRRRSW